MLRAAAVDRVHEKRATRTTNGPRRATGQIHEDPIPMAVVRVTDGCLAGYDDGARFVWWYQHHGRLAFDGQNYAAYFGVAITVDGDLVLASDVGYWTAWSQGNQIRLDHFTTGASDRTVANAGPSSHPHLVSYGPDNIAHRVACPLTMRYWLTQYDASG
jgi:hypothetical protein